MLARLVIKFIRLQLFLKRQHYKDYSGFKIATNTGYPASSFRNKILFPSNEINEDILNHEIEHLKKRHYLDRIFIGLVQSFLFFMVPLYWLKKELYAVHEFQADTASDTNAQDYANLLLQQQFEIKRIPFLNTFFSHPLKRRIMMYCKTTTRNYFQKQIITALTVMLISGIIFLQSMPQASAQDQQQPQKEYAVAPKPSVDISKFLSENINYPEDAVKKKIEGVVILQFIVSGTGKTQDVRVLKSVDKMLDEEAVRIVNSLPDWTPAKNKDGEFIAVNYQIPIQFKLK